MSLKADDVLALIAKHPHVMGTLDSGTCAIEHVSRRIADGPDERIDTCPCERRITPPEVLSDTTEAQRLRELGGGQYVSSPRHTLGDLVRDAVGG
jgi:hypothetical protein